VWTQLFATTRPISPRSELTPNEPADPVESVGGSLRSLVRRLLVGLLAGLGVGMVAAALVWWQWPSGGTTAPDAGVTPDASPPIAPAENGPIEPDPSTAGQENVVFGIVLVSSLLLVGGLAIGRIRSRRRRNFVPGPWKYSLQVPLVTRPVLDEDSVVDGAAHLTWQADQDLAGDVDIDRSVQATVATGGAPVIIHRPPPVAPKYLVLEDSDDGSERWRFLYDELLRRLSREGVDITRYTFTSDPSSCTSIDGRVSCELRDLVEHCDALIVIGDGDAAFDPIEDKPAGWLQLLHHVPRRLWLNPIPESRWSRGAQTIGRDTPIEHAIAGGLAALQNTSVNRRLDAVGFPRVIERAPDTSIGFAALRNHIGPAGLRAVAAVAMVGTPSIAVLRWLVEEFRLALDEGTWLRVATLRWFRSGAWPEGLQARLVAWLQAADVRFADAVAKAATALLVENEPPPGSAAHLEWGLKLTATRACAGDRADQSARHEWWFAYLIGRLIAVSVAVGRRSAYLVGEFIALSVPGARRFAYPIGRLITVSVAAGRRRFAYLIIGLIVAAVAVAITFFIVRATRETTWVTGSIHIESVPRGCDVYFNGTRLTVKTPLTVEGVPGGTRHDIRVELPRHKAYLKTVDIPKTGGEVSVTALMKPLPGKLVVNSQPGGADILINGQLRGRTPTTLNNIDMATAKKLELRLKGYQPFVTDLEWPTNGQIMLDPKLQR
jgi:hypothetical protein